MKIRYTDGPDVLTVTPAGRSAFAATRGEWIEDVPADVAESLIAQGWESDAKRAPKNEKE